MGSVLNRLVFEPPEAEYTPKLLTHGIWVRSKKGGYDIPVLRFQRPNSKFILIYSHGNAEDLGSICDWCEYLSKQLGVDVYSYDYCGYGCHKPEDHTLPTEDNVLDDANSLVKYVQSHRRDDQKIVVWGRSLGSAPAIATASGDPTIDGLIVESGFLTCVKTRFSLWNSSLDMFRNEDWIVKCVQPVLVMHGEQDTIVPIWHGKRLHELAPRPWNKGRWFLNGSHNNLDTSFRGDVIRTVKEYMLDLNADDRTDSFRRGFNAPSL